MRPAKTMCCARGRGRGRGERENSSAPFLSAGNGEGGGEISLRQNWGSVAAFVRGHRPTQPDELRAMTD